MKRPALDVSQNSVPRVARTGAPATPAGRVSRYALLALTFSCTLIDEPFEPPLVVRRDPSTLAAEDGIDASPVESGPARGCVRDDAGTVPSGAEAPCASSISRLDFFAVDEGEAVAGEAVSGEPGLSSPPRAPQPRGVGAAAAARVEASLAADAGVTDAEPPLLPSPRALAEPDCSGWALHLDGASFAVLPWTAQGDFTLEAWIETSESLGQASAFNGRAVFDADVIGMGNQNDFAVTVLNDRLAFGVGAPDTSVQGLSVVTANEWVHVAITRQASSGQLQIIVNGALDASATIANRGPLSARRELALGGFSTTRKFIGSIDEVRVWNIVRSVEEIKANQRVRLTGSEQGLVGYYAFEDQGVAQTADDSAMGSDATLRGTPEYVRSSALCLRDR